MIESVIITINGKADAPDFSIHEGRLGFPVVCDADTPTAITIRFSKEIKSFRNSTYQWNAPVGSVAGELSPKLLKLSDDCFVQASIASGTWEITDSHTLLWKFNQTEAAPIAEYKGETNEKFINRANRRIDKIPALLFSYENGIEFSRSPDSFRAVACFTDHCDYDTAENLQIQRELFQRCGLKVTKGFFLYHFSKRPDNASYGRDASELEKWRADGHELAYHSLSQSIKDDYVGLKDFESFDPPFPDIPTYIDHGYQPYNLTLFRNSKLTEEIYSDTLAKKNITVLWNYIDCGTAGQGIINQMNPHQFTASAFWKSTEGFPMKKRLAMMIKNLVFHTYADRKLIRAYMNLASSVKKILREKKVSNLMDATSKGFTLSRTGLRTLINWRRIKSKPYALAKYTPILFAHTIGGHQFQIFQTLEMIDFRKSLSEENLKMLVEECGLFIAHTYFSAPFEYHTGRMIRNGKVDSVVEANFIRLGQLIREGKIWNPTLSELVDYLTGYNDVECEVVSGRIVVKNSGNLHYRTVA